jgi:hypothetical protein
MKASLFDYIFDLLPGNEKELWEMVRTGYTYVPYVPLQVSHIFGPDIKNNSAGNILIGEKKK